MCLSNTFYLISYFHKDSIFSNKMNYDQNYTQENIALIDFILPDSVVYALLAKQDQISLEELNGLERVVEE